jgi:hypothetical protein
LFEEERHSEPDAAVANVSNPPRVHRPGSGTGFASNDHPIDSVKRKTRDGTDQWFYGKETDNRWDLPEAVNAPGVRLTLYTHTHPEIRWPRELWRQIRQALSSLGQDLEHVPSGPLNHRKHLSYVLKGHLLVEEVAHGVDEDEPGPCPSEWLS